MSTSLSWKPIIPQESNDLPLKLKFVLRKRYDGSVNTRMDRRDLSYLQALKDAGIDGASELIDAINTYDNIAVFEE